MLRKIIDEINVSNAAEFVYEFKLENLFYKLFGISIEEWQENVTIGDDEIITKLLEKVEGTYFFCL